MKKAIQRTGLPLLGLCALLGVMVRFVSFGQSTSIASNEDTVITSVQVESVKIILLPTSPVRVQIVVQGQKWPGADVEVKQERKDNQVVIAMTQIRPSGSRIDAAPFQERLFLNGGFAPGSYSLRVNNYSTMFEVR